MRLSIIIPIFNIEKYIGRCLDSLVNQNLSKDDYEIIILDDGSTDNGVEIVKLFVSKANIKIISQKNSGPAKARNTGLKEARGKFIYFIDGDDYLVLDVFQAFLEIMEANKLDVLGFDTLITNKEEKSPLVSDNRTQKVAVLQGIEFINEYRYRNEVWWYIFNKSFLLKNNLQFDERTMLEDGIFTSKLILAANKIAHIPLNVHRYYKREGSIMSSKNKITNDKLLYAYEYVANQFSDIVSKVKKKTQHPDNAIKRLVSRQQSYVFFLIARMLKERRGNSEIKTTINRLKDKNLYPIKSFIGEDYNGLIIRFLTFIFNREWLLLKIAVLRRMI